MTYKIFSDLPIWQDGARLLEKIYNLTKNFPSDEKYALTSQLKRAANSIIANFAESHGRYFFRDKIRVLYIARGEIEELRSHIMIAHKLGYLSKEVFKDLNDCYGKLLKNLNSYILNLVNKCK